MSVHELLVLCGLFDDFVSKAYTLALIRAQTLKSYAKTVNLYNITFFRNKTPVAKLRFCESLFDQFLVIRMVKPSGINSVKFQRDKVLIINTIYSLTHFLYFWVVKPL